MWVPAQTASVDSKRKHLFCHYQFSPLLPSLLDVPEESVTVQTNVRGTMLTHLKQDTQRTASICAKTQCPASGTLMTRKQTNALCLRIATPQLAVTHAPLGKNIAPMDTMVCKDPVQSNKLDFFTNFTGDDESVTEALDKTVTVQVEDPTWLCDIDWSQTYRLSTYKGKEVLLKNDFDLNSIWGPGTPGSGKDDGICEFIAVHCRDSYDGFGTDVICSKTYKWFSH